MYDPIDILKKWVTVRQQKTYKYEAGYLFILAGSETYPGAAILATHAAMRLGVGGVIVGTPAAVKPLVLNCVPEAIVLNLSATPDGFLTAEDLPLINEALAKCKAVLIGPGLGRHYQTIALIHRLLTDVNLPMVIDADGLYALAEFGYERLTEIPRLITPHRGECSWFMKEEPNEKTLQDFAHQWKSIVLYKGFPGRVISPFDPLYLNETGNTAATTAGCGDVLAGFCASLIAQGLSTHEAAIAGLYLAGLAADKAVSCLHLPALMASDIITHIPMALEMVLKTIDQQ